MIDSRASGGLGGAAQGAAIGSKILPGWGTAIGAVAGGLLGAFSGGGESDAKKLAEEQARLIRKTGLENQRRAELEMEQVLGRTRAAIGASNLQFTGSSKSYYNELESQLRADISWEREQAMIEERIAKRGGQIAARQIQRSSFAGMIGGFSSAAKVFGPTLIGGPVEKKTI